MRHPAAAGQALEERMANIVESSVSYPDVDCSLGEQLHLGEQPHPGEKAL